MFDKTFWNRLTRPIDLDDYPALPCPHCGNRELVLAIESFQHRDLPLNARTAAFLQATTPYSQKTIRDAFDKGEGMALFMGIASFSQAIKYLPAHFVCFFECASCGASVSALGGAAIPKPAYARENIKIKVEHFSPPIPMFPLHTSIPTSVASELLSAFSYFHSDILSSGAKLRRATEQFCNVLGFTEGQLHNRIEKMSSTYPQEADWLRSLKLVGNEATHSVGVEESDILHSFEIFAELTDFLVRRSRVKTIQQSAQSIQDKFKKKP